MRHLIAVFAVLIPISLTGCFQGEDEAALDMVKNGYLDSDKSSTVGNMLSGYKYFDEVNWSYFKTPQGKRIVEFTGYVKLWEHAEERQRVLNEGVAKSQRDGTLDFLMLFPLGKAIADPNFLNAAEKFGLQSKSLVQFTILPDDKFEVSYQGQELVADQAMLPDMPENMVKIIKAVDRPDETVLDNVYANKITTFPAEAIAFWKAYEKEKRREGSIYNRAETSKSDAQENMAIVMPNLVPGVKAQNFVEGNHYTEANGGILMMFKTKAGKWHGLVDASTVQSSCSISGAFKKTSAGFELEAVYDDDGDVKAGACQMVITSIGSRDLNVQSNCHEMFCGMNGYLNGEYRIDLKADITSMDALNGSTYGKDLPPSYVITEK